MKKKVVFGVGILIIVVVVLLVIFLGDKHLDMTSTQVSTLYSYLGEVDVNRCGGLNQYIGEEVTYDDLSNNNKMCIAYYELSDDEKTSDTQEVTSTNDNDLDICEIGEGIRLVASEGEDTCSFEVIAKEDLEDAYQTVYGNDLPEDEEFYISSNIACYLEEDQYYCGEAETFVQSLTPEATVYRLMDSAIKKLNGDIVISDYYLKVSDNRCYPSGAFEDEITACSDALADDASIQIDEDFVREHGALYEHVFKENADGSYYWYSSNLK